MGLEAAGTAAASASPTFLYKDSARQAISCIGIAPFTIADDCQFSNMILLGLLKANVKYSFFVH